MSKNIQKELSRDVLVGEMHKEISRFSASGSAIERRVAWFHHMQETQPVRYRPEHNLWEVFRYKDVQQVLLDYSTFSVDNCLPETFPSALGRSDPPEHRQLRSLVAKAFSPSRIEELTPCLVKIVDEKLEQASTAEKINLVSALAHPLPMHVIAEMLGLPPQDQVRFQQWASQLVGQLTGKRKPESNAEILDYFSDLFNERKHDPRDDLMSAFLAAEENGAYLTRENILSLCVELMMAGIFTTSHLLTFMLQRLSQYPEIYQALRTDPSLIPGAIEETLRYDFSTLDLWRTARHDTVFNGHQIRAGQYVVAWTGAANFDETYFPHPEQFDIRRSPNPHLSFGHGIHVCLGYPLARLEVRIALERIVTHFPVMRLDP